jgi:hypothetical protein
VSIELDPSLCFVLMPMTDEFRGIYDLIIKPTVTDLGMNCLYAGELFGATPIMEDVWNYCAKARVVIADLTGANTNVYYEAGYSHAFDREKVIFITQEMKDVTFDVKHFRCIAYDPHPSTLGRLRTELAHNLKAVLEKEPGRLTEVTRTVEKTVAVPEVSEAELNNALILKRMLRSAERGHAIAADAFADRLRDLLDARLKVPSRVSPIKRGRHTVVNVACDYELRVHGGPGRLHPVVGTIPPYARGVDVEGEANSQGAEPWVPVRYEGLSGWANSDYLARQEGQVDDHIARRALHVVMALKHEDMDSLALIAHPDKGVRFSPYAYVEHWHQVLTRDQIASALASEETHHWGTDQGSGAPIHLTFREYYDRFVYDVDFARPDVVYLDQHFQSGHTINNIPEMYADAVTIEYQFEGINPEFGGLDWRGLRLVVQELAGTWYLVGVTHDEMGT